MNQEKILVPRVTKPILRPVLLVTILFFKMNVGIILLNSLINKMFCESLVYVKTK